MGWEAFRPGGEKGKGGRPRPPDSTRTHSVRAGPKEHEAGQTQPGDLRRQLADTLRKATKDEVLVAGHPPARTRTDTAR